MIDYRPFQGDDAEPCRTIVLACLDEITGIGPDAREGLRRRIETSPYREDLARMFCLVAVDDGAIVGLGALEGLQIKRMYVDPLRRGEGIGRELYNRLEREARRRSVVALELEAAMNAAGFYRRLGFRDVRENTWLLQGSPITSLIMRKVLADDTAML